MIYHAHVYFPAELTATAARLRQELGAALPLRLGRLHERPVGPHPLPMFQAIVPAERLGETVFWLMQHRGSLSVLIHADSGDDWVDHTQHTMWLGDALPLNTAIFNVGNPERPVHARSARN